MDTSVRVPRPRSAWGAIAGTWVLRIVLVTAALLALRAAAPLYADAQGRALADFDALEALASASAVAAYGLVILAACLFTLACRLPLALGVTWTPLLLGIIPAVLAAHLPLVASTRFDNVDWLNRFYFSTATSRAGR